MHVAGLPEFTHSRVDQPEAGSTLLPGEQLIGSRRLPRERIELRTDVAGREVGSLEQDVPVELPPHELAQIVVGVVAAGRAAGGCDARPDLEGTQLAEPKVRTEVRGRVERRIVAPVVVRQTRRRRTARACRARMPRPASTAARVPPPSRVSWAGAASPRGRRPRLRRTHRGGCRQRFARCRLVETCPQERREHPIRGRRCRCGWCRARTAGSRGSSTAPLHGRAGGSPGRHRCRGSCRSGDSTGRLAASVSSTSRTSSLTAEPRRSVKAPPIACERFAQGGEAVVQPPAGRAAEWTDAGALLIKHINHDDGSSAVRRGRQRGVVRQPQVVAQPDDRRAIGHQIRLRERDYPCLCGATMSAIEGASTKARECARARKQGPHRDRGHRPLSRPPHPRNARRRAGAQRQRTRSRRGSRRNAAILVDPASFRHLRSALLDRGWHDATVRRIRILPPARLSLAHRDEVAGLDLYPFIPGFFADPEETFDIIWERHKEVPLRGHTVRALGRINSAILASHDGLDGRLEPGPQQFRLLRRPVRTRSQPTGARHHR